MSKGTSSSAETWDAISWQASKLKEYTEMLNQARQIAIKRMVDEAETMGADAIINIRYASSSIMQGAAEVIAYGTAVKYKL